MLWFKIVVTVFACHILIGTAEIIKNKRATFNTYWVATVQAFFLVGIWIFV